jgi:hypothetical protein
VAVAAGVPAQTDHLLMVVQAAEVVDFQKRRYYFHS